MSDTMDVSGGNVQDANAVLAEPEVEPKPEPTQAELDRGHLDAAERLLLVADLTADQEGAVQRAFALARQALGT